MEKILLEIKLNKEALDSLKKINQLLIEIRDQLKESNMKATEFMNDIDKQMRGVAENDT